MHNKRKLRLLTECHSDHTIAVQNFPWVLLFLFIMQLTSFTYIIIPYINNLLGLFWNANRNISTNKKTYEKRFVDYCTFNNMQTLQFKAQPTNAFFATINQVLSDSSQLPTTAEGMVIKSMSTVQTTKQCSTVVGSWEEPPNI